MAGSLTPGTDDWWVVAPVCLFSGPGLFMWSPDVARGEAGKSFSHFCLCPVYGCLLAQASQSKPRRVLESGLEGTIEGQVRVLGRGRICCPPQSYFMGACTYTWFLRKVTNFSKKQKKGNAYIPPLYEIIYLNP